MIQWLNKRRLNKKIKQALKQCHEIYHATPSFHLAKQGRENQQLFSYEYIYGEIDFATFAQLLMRCEMKPNSIFYDLGSGAGKAVVCAALLHEFQRACGVEHLQLLHECASAISTDSGLNNVCFYHADLLKHDWLDADILFINAATFVGEFWQKLLLQLEHLRAGTQIILVSRELPPEAFEMLYNDFLAMSWGYARVGIYKKR